MVQKVNMPRLMISAPSKSSGKTTVSLGMLRYFTSRGVPVCSFKKGPDYIDPMWHRLASGGECRNLDPWMMGEEGCREVFACQGEPAGTLRLIEGNHGLHDGMSPDGSDSSAGLAALLGAPVLLVLDASGMNRGGAAQVLGLQMMPPRADVAGVVLNRVKGPRHADKLAKAIETYCGVPVLGRIPNDAHLQIPERYLGLATVDETRGADAFISRAEDAVSRFCDMDAISNLFHQVAPMPARGFSVHSAAASVRIGIMRNEAFSFYYPDNLEALERSGAQLVMIDPFRDNLPPGIDGLYIGGGFPELFIEQLAANRRLLRSLRDAVEDGMPVYAECGGLIYLSDTVEHRGMEARLAGLLPYRVDMSSRPVGHGYLELESSRNSPWFGHGEAVRAHEFHYARTSVVPGSQPELDFQFYVRRGYGIDGNHDGVLYRRLFASFAHLHASACPAWAKRFVSLADRYQRERDHEENRKKRVFVVEKTGLIY